MKNKILFVLSIISFESWAQGPKWSESGNTVSATSFFGTINNFPLVFKVNNTEYLSISPTGTFKFNSLAGSGDAFISINSAGILSRKNFTGNASDVLFGNGTFGSLSAATGWFTSSGITYTNNKIGIGGISSPIEALEVNGSGVFNGNVMAQQFVAGDVVNSGKQLRINSSLCMKGFDASIPGSRSEVCAMGNDFYIQSTSGINKHTILNFSNSGNVGIGTATPSYKLEVSGDMKVSGSLYFSALSMSGLNMDFIPGFGSSPGILRAGIGPLTVEPRPLPPCIAPTIPLVHQINGMYHSWGASAFGGTINDMTMGFDGANAIIDIAGTSTFPNAPSLLLNYYCGKNVAICTGEAGGDVFMSTGNTTSIVGIGTGCIPTGYKLGVNGRIICNGIKVQLADGGGCWPDYVFDADYRMLNLFETELFIKKHKHLPNVPSSKEVKENGIALEEMNMILLQKIEEITLQMIEMKKEIEVLNLKNK